MRDIAFDWVRPLDLLSFTGDDWALETTLALPPASVPRFVVNAASGEPVRWTVAAMTTGRPTAEQTADAATNFATRLVKVARSDRGTGSVRLLAPTTGPNANREFTEFDVSPGDVFVVALSNVTVNVGSAPFLWAYPVSGAELLLEGITP